MAQSHLMLAANRSKSVIQVIPEKRYIFMRLINLTDYFSFIFFSLSNWQRGETTKAAIDLPTPPLKQLKEQAAEVEERPQKSLNEKQQEYQDLLIRCIVQNLGFSKGRPVAACIIYKCLRQWRSFEVERTSIFDRIIQTIGHAIETQDNNEVLAYWLSNASTLLLLLQRTLKAGGAAGVTPQFRRQPSLFGRMTQATASLATITGAMAVE
ncbi:Myosin-H heavy chain-like [Heracleum sosnowskyi]|uniref:Myosin-H heavy chain-like n=1 Tax=Heracleum sosnowskyi TaxID=360622 RepID=A0AAD8N708_9APIA|nr:Myosin-H heavy chain-like [Heracleum sosnowskyi]